MFNWWMDDLKGLFDTRQSRFLRRLGNGRAVSTYVPLGSPDGLAIQFEHKIGDADLKDGKLRPLAVQVTKRRGGKRSLTILLTPESAEALHQTLGLGLKKINQRRRGRTLVEVVLGIAVNMDDQKRSPVVPLSVS